MNIKPFFQQVLTAIKESQDNSTLKKGDIYSDLLIALIEKNTEKQEGAIDRGEVDTEALESDVKYAINQLGSALVAISRFNKK